MNPHYALHALSLAVIGCLIWKWPTQEVAPAPAKSAEKSALPGAQKGVSTVGTKEKIAAGAKAKAPGKALSEVDRILEENQRNEDFHAEALKFLDRMIQRRNVLRNKIMGLSPEDSERINAIDTARISLCSRGGWFEDAFSERETNPEEWAILLANMPPEARSLAEQIKTLDGESKTILDRYPKTQDPDYMVMHSLQNVSDEDFELATDSIATVHTLAKTMEDQAKNADASRLEKLKLQWNEERLAAEKFIATMSVQRDSLSDYRDAESKTASIDLNSFTPEELKDKPQQTKALVDAVDPEGKPQP